MVGGSVFKLVYPNGAQYTLLYRYYTLLRHVLKTTMSVMLSGCTG